MLLLTLRVANGRHRAGVTRLPSFSYVAVPSSQPVQLLGTLPQPPVVKLVHSGVPGCRPYRQRGW